MATYAGTRLSEARSSLKLLLGLPSSSSFWTDSELNLYIKEALSTWATCSLTNRKRVNFNTTANQPFYNLTTCLPNSELALTSTDRDIASSLEYSLIEPQTTDWVTWGGTTQFSLSAIEKAIQRARDQFLLLTGMIQQVSLLPTSSPPISRVDLPLDTLDVRRVASKNLAGEYKTLSKEDELTLNAYSPGWQIAEEGVQPSYYSLISEPTLQLQLAPIATDITFLHYILIQTGFALDLSTGVQLAIPEPFYWVIKYGALYELLGPHSQAHDPLRAKYCKLRWDEGIALAKLYPSILNAEINGEQVSVSSLYDIDQYNWDWQNLTGTPTEIATCSWNLIALSPVPSTSEISISLDIVKNPPLPSLDTDFIQVDEATLLIILEFARHLALFKRGGAEFTLSKQGYDRMVEAASLQNSRLKAQSPFFSSLVGNVTRELTQNRLKAEDPEEGGA